MPIIIRETWKEKGNKNIYGGLYMSWIGWVVIVIMGFNVLFFGALGVITLIDEWKERRQDEQ